MMPIQKTSGRLKPKFQTAFVYHAYDDALF